MLSNNCCCCCCKIDPLQVFNKYGGMIYIKDVDALSLDGEDDDLDDVIFLYLAFSFLNIDSDMDRIKVE